ncbi:MAG TPA: hypothetical protein VEI57_02750 [Nitrospirota bacterium]|nr:hypothetical protein [Nitrospirota bacterium]
MNRSRHVLSYAVLVICATLVCCTDKVEHSGNIQLYYNQTTLSELDHEIARSNTNERYSAVLKGLRWCVIFFDNDKNFDFTFSNYMTMLDELSLHSRRDSFTSIVHTLIQKEFKRVIPRLPKLFEANEDGYEEFINILPIAYHHQIPIQPLQEFANGHFAHVNLSDKIQKFKRAARQLNYELLTDLVIEAAFIDMDYRWKADRDFRLPPNGYQAILKECEAIPFLYNYKSEKYHDQNYYATHVLLALNHYGQKPLKPSATSDKVFFYLTGQYNRIRYHVDDLDLLSECLYCFKQFAPMNVEFIGEGERYIISQQHEDGSWGTSDDFKGDPYDQFHPTWTAIVLLVQEP